MSEPDVEPVVFAPPAGVVLRVVGYAVVLLGVAVIGWTLVITLLDASWLRAVLGTLSALVGLVAIVLLVSGSIRLLGRGPRLQMDQAGFVNRTGWQPGVRAAAWRDVVKVQEERGDLVLELADGRSSRIRTAAIGTDAPTLAKALRERLNKGHGYRPLR